MSNFTQKELLGKEFNMTNNGIVGGLLKEGLYLFGATSKIGKSMIATALSNAVATGTDYLGKSNSQGKVIYFDNDNYPFETKNRVKALGFEESDNIKYYFEEETNSLRDIKDELKYIGDELDEVKLVIIDCLINLSEFEKIESKFYDDYPKIREFRDFIVEKKLVCIMLHHTKKGVAVGQDKLIGSKAMSAATTGTILLEVEDEFSKIGTLNFILRHKKEKIKVTKDQQDIGWDICLSDEDDISEEIPRNVLFIINKVVNDKDRRIKGTCQELVAMTGIDINPGGLLKYLKKHHALFEQNYVRFENRKEKGNRIIIIEYDPVEGR